jgi:hypothetical protein
MYLVQALDVHIQNDWNNITHFNVFVDVPAIVWVKHAPVKPHI